MIVMFQINISFKQKTLRSMSKRIFVVQPGSVIDALYTIVNIFITSVAIFSVQQQVKCALSFKCCARTLTCLQGVDNCRVLKRYVFSRIDENISFFENKLLKILFSIWPNQAAFLGFIKFNWRIMLNHQHTMPLLQHDFTFNFGFYCQINNSLYCSHFICAKRAFLKLHYCHVIPLMSLMTSRKKS